eukprot:366031-Chlamydomonas_euryale.AAC.10
MPAPTSPYRVHVGCSPTQPRPLDQPNTQSTRFESSAFGQEGPESPFCVAAGISAVLSRAGDGARALRFAAVLDLRSVCKCSPNPADCTAIA